MRLKRFTAANVPDAMNKVRQTLGPNAIILATQEDDNGEIAITAAIEDGALEDLEIHHIATDLGSIDELTSALEHHRLPKSVTDRLLNDAAALVASDWPTALAGAIDANFGFSPLPNEPLGRPLMLVGEAGVGKTAVLAKLALHARLAGYPCHLISLDGRKAGGPEQVRAFARALEAKLDLLDEANYLPSLIGGIVGCPQILIDTPGLNSFDEAQLSEAHDIAKSVGAEPLVVLAAGGDAIETAETAMSFMGLGAKRMVITKVDSTKRFGALFSAAYAGGLTFLAASRSPQISSGLMQIDPAFLANLIMPGPDHTNQAQRQEDRVP